MTLFNTPMEEVRSRRDNRLQMSDWTQFNDSPLSDSKKTEWATYRQELRDLPATASPEYSDEGMLVNVTWPIEP